MTQNLDFENLLGKGIVERAKRERTRKSPHARKVRRGGEKNRLVSPFLAWGNVHAPSRFAHSTIPEEKWGLLVVYA